MPKTVLNMNKLCCYASLWVRQGGMFATFIAIVVDETTVAVKVEHRASEITGLISIFIESLK